jgi:hypothetical protein
MRKATKRSVKSTLKQLGYPVAHALHPDTEPRPSHVQYRLYFSMDGGARSQRYVSHNGFYVYQIPTILKGVGLQYVGVTWMSLFARNDEYAADMNQQNRVVADALREIYTVHEVLNYRTTPMHGRVDFIDYLQVTTKE